MPPVHWLPNRHFILIVAVVRLIMSHQQAKRARRKMSELLTGGRNLQYGGTTARGLRRGVYQ